MTIELAPNNKSGLALAVPLMAGSGATGFADAWPPGLDPGMFGAVVTSPVSRKPRKGLAQPRLAEMAGGFLLATGDHNPGYRRVVDRHAADWRRLGVPVLMALAATAMHDWADLAASLEEETPVAGIELAIDESVDTRTAAAAIAAVRRSTTLPLLVKLPVVAAVPLAVVAGRNGADALVVGTPPMAAYPSADGTTVEAPVSGPIAFPFTLRALRAVVALDLGLPLVAAGGMHSVEHAMLCLRSGAVAVQLRSLVWTDPAAAARLAASLGAEAENLRGPAAGEDCP